MIKRLFRSDGKIFLATEPVDMRKSINGLAAIVQNDFDLDLYENAMFVFINRAKDKVKILYWDQDGFIVYYKRREQGRFAWPSRFREGKVNEVTYRDLQQFLKGLMMESYITKPSFIVC